MEFKLTKAQCKEDELMELAQEWIDRGFGVTMLQNGATPYYQLFHEDLFGLRIVAGSSIAGEMNGLAQSVWERMMAIRAAQEDDGEVE